MKASDCCQHVNQNLDYANTELIQIIILSKLQLNYSQVLKTGFYLTITADPITYYANPFSDK